MIGFAVLMLPAIVKNTRISFIGRALLALLLPLNIFVQFHSMLLGLLVEPAMAFTQIAPPIALSFRKNRKPTKLDVFPESAAYLDSRHVKTTTADKIQWNRRRLLALVTASMPVTMMASEARADNSTDVDWASFGASLQQPQQFQSTPPVGGGSDLEKALQESAKRKAIDPRTHG